MTRQGLLIFSYLAVSLNVTAQAPVLYSNADRYYYNGLELFEKEKYGAAQEQFKRAYDEYGSLRTELKSDAEYYIAMCAVHLFNEDAESLAGKYLRDNPESPKVNDMRFRMANHLFQKKQYRSATGWYEEVDRNKLEPDKKPEYFFKKGYCYFQRNDYDRASLAFFEIKDRDTYYTAPAIYYYAHIAYQQEKYETALREFLRIQDDESFGPIVPYYILQIYYLQKKYDEIISRGPALLEVSTPSREPEIAKFIGDACYKKERYREAIPYLEKYIEKNNQYTPEDQYALAYSWYRAGEYARAASIFEKVSGRRSLTGQYASYHLADCYLRTGDKNRARLAFSAASDLDYDAKVQEDALFNLAKITYELSYSPFNEAIRAFNEYIQKYPGSDRIDEVYSYLGMAFLNTRNYKMALQSLDKILVKNDQIKRSYQRIAFYRGLELIRDLQFEQAMDALDLSLRYRQYDRQTEARACYWKADILYRQEDYSGAAGLYSQFLSFPAAFSLPEYAMAHYNLGYAQFTLGQYQQAQNSLRKFVSLYPDKKANLVADAYNRVADAYFVSSQYETAVEFYDRSFALGTSAADYAMYQKGFTLGLLKRHSEKIQVLDKLLADFPKSGLRDDAWFEKGKSFVILQQPDRAITAYQRILDEFPRSSYVSKALLQLGLVYYNTNQPDKSISYYKKVISDFPASPEARNALTGLKNVYVDLNDVDQYFSYVRGLGSFADVSRAEQDSLTYISAENLYMGGNCGRALQVFDSYLEQFPRGSFVLNAHFYRAECLAREGNTGAALESYNSVIRSPRSLFTEPALASAASIQFRNKNYPDALENYLILGQVAELQSNRDVAALGQLRCYYLLENYPRVAGLGESVLQSGFLQGEDEREVRFMTANALLKSGEPGKAQAHFMILSREVSSRIGAESKYRVAEIHHLNGQADRAEQVIIEMIGMNTPQQYWMARAFLLLADVLVLKNDLFQARYTLQSLIEGYGIRGDGIIEEAEKNLEKILLLERMQNPRPDTVPEVKMQ